MEKYAVIVAGGKGNRMGSAIPKQFIEVAGKPLLMHTLQRFKMALPTIHLIVVLPAYQMEYWRQLCNKYEFDLDYQLVAGGEERFHSVRNGLKVVPDGAIVGIHDGVRCSFKLETVQKAFLQAEAVGSAVVAVPLKDSLRYVSPTENKAVKRSDYQLIQTPQVFFSSLIKAAYHQDFDSNFTDSASVLEAKGHAIALSDGDYQNIKVTTPEDLQLAALWLTKAED